MKLFILIVIQLITGLIGTAAVYASGISNGWELIAIPIVCAIGISLIGVALQRNIDGAKRPLAQLFTGALIASALGAAILLIPGAWGFQAILLPVGGAIIGYQIATRL